MALYILAELSQLRHRICLCRSYCVGQMGGQGSFLVCGTWYTVSSPTCRFV